MRRWMTLAVFLMVLSLLFVSLAVAGQVHVRGYTRSNGTYVQPHDRTTPDGNPYNNYSYPGNYNPNTGTTTKGNPDTYLDHYYNRSSSPSYEPSRGDPSDSDDSEESD